MVSVAGAAQACSRAVERLFRSNVGGMAEKSIGLLYDQMDLPDDTKRFRKLER